MNILLPVAGKSTRFPNVRPKWLLTNPNGNLMVVDSIIGMQINEIDSIHIIYLKEHEELFSFKKGLIQNFEKYNLNNRLNFIELNYNTKHQVETIRYGLQNINSDIPFLIKDSDNSFQINTPLLNNNFVSYCRLENLNSKDIISKSYLELDNMGIITNIVEKKIISDKFCCGGYYFNSSKEFLEYSNIDSDNLFVSDIVYNMMLNNKNFMGIECSNYEDWGTLDSWHKYKSTFKTLFIDLDGVIFGNSSAYIKPYIGDTEAIQANVNYIKSLVDSNRIEIIFTTSRNEEYRDITEQQLVKLNLKYKYLIMGLYHSQRIIINDFSNTNPYRSCEAINVERNSDNLKNYLTGIIK